MLKTIQIEDDVFSYLTYGNYITILDYKNLNSKQSIEKISIDLIIPETIDGLPVLLVEWLNLDKSYHYSSATQVDGSGCCSEINILLPSHTVFKGVAIPDEDTDVYMPCFKIEYYPRTTKLLCYTSNGFSFFTKKYDENSCEIIAITPEVKSERYSVRYNHEWLWKKTEKFEPKTLEIPDVIEGQKVVKICDFSTKPLPNNISSIRFGDNLMCIGTNCFSELRLLANVYLGKSIKSIGDNSFSLCTTEKCADVPQLTVYYKLAIPQYHKSAFYRYAEVENYKEFMDWGYMYDGTVKRLYEVIFKKR